MTRLEFEKLPPQLKLEQLRSRVKQLQDDYSSPEWKSPNERAAIECDILELRDEFDRVMQHLGHKGHFTPISFDGSITIPENEKPV